MCVSELVLSLVSFHESATRAESPQSSEKRMKRKMKKMKKRKMQQQEKILWHQRDCGMR